MLTYADVCGRMRTYAVRCGASMAPNLSLAQQTHSFQDNVGWGEWGEWEGPGGDLGAESLEDSESNSDKQAPTESGARLLYAHQEYREKKKQLPISFGRLSEKLRPGQLEVEGGQEEDELDEPLVLRRGTSSLRPPTRRDPSSLRPQRLKTSEEEEEEDEDEERQEEARRVLRRDEHKGHRVLKADHHRNSRSTEHIYMYVCIPCAHTYIHTYTHTHTHAHTRIHAYTH